MIGVWQWAPAGSIRWDLVRIHHRKTTVFLRDPRQSGAQHLTQDDARMRRFFENELAARGKTRADFAGEKYVAGPLDEQRFFRPAACTRGKVSGPMDSSSGKEATRAMSTCLRPAQLPDGAAEPRSAAKERCGALMSLPMASRSKAEP